jgi:hypothetical protein
MIRPLTAACMLLSCGSGLYLYQVKHRTGMLDRQIEATLEAANTARQRSAVLQAEFTLLNDPERLAGLAAHFLPLQTTQPGQFTIMAELDKRLPAVRPPDAPAQTTDEPPDSPLPASLPGPEAQPSLQPALPAPSPSLPMPVARAEPAKPAPTAATTAKPAPGAVAAASRPTPDRTREAARSADHQEAARAERQTAEAAPREARSGAASLGGTPVAAAVPSYRPAAAQYAARLAPPPLAVYTPPPQPAGAPGYTQSALGMAHTCSVAPFAGNYNVPNGN